MSGGPLNGVRVIDLCSVVSGPMCTATLADQGADVIKVESLTGDQMRRGRGGRNGLAPGFISCNRGKRAIAIDLKHEQGRAILNSLVSGADVFAQNFRPGAIERLGFDAPTLCARHPRLVYLSISGVGERGPYATKRVYDPIIQALSGLADIQADPASGRPRMVRTLIADKTTAIYAAQAVTAALLHRERTGRGQHVQVAMLDVMLSFLWPEGMSDHTLPDEGDQSGPASAHDMIFDTADEPITVGAVSDAEWRGLCAALEQPTWLTDPRFATPALRSANRQVRLQQVGDVLRHHGRRHWLARLEQADVPCAPVLRRRDVIDDAQVRANALVEDVEWPHVGRVRQARPAARFDATPTAIGGPAPVLGEHTRAVLEEIGFEAHTIDEWFDAGIIA